jgi:lipoprotein-releasing system permease protein
MIDGLINNAGNLTAFGILGLVFTAILLLVTAVASFNVVSTLVMLVREKRHDIGILRTYGVSPRSLMLTFVALGTAIGLLGVLSGILLGWAVAANITGIVRVLEHLLGVHLIDAKVYFIDELPSRVRLADVGRIGVTAFVLACLSTLLPASWAARTQPAEALRHDQ